MVGSINRAVEAARRAIESLYEDEVTVTEYQDVTDEETKMTRKQPVTVLENEPCRLSFKQLAGTSQEGDAAVLSQVTKLFLAPEITIKAGCRLTVTRKNGWTMEYASSGIPAMYETHQEIILKLFERWA
jgi:hypothetical protein